MRTPHNLRDRAQANAAPRAVGFALFVVIALALLATVRSGPLATAEASRRSCASRPHRPAPGARPRRCGDPAGRAGRRAHGPGHRRSRSGYRAHRRPDHSGSGSAPVRGGRPGARDGHAGPRRRHGRNSTHRRVLRATRLLWRRTPTAGGEPPPVETPTDPNKRPLLPVEGRNATGDGSTQMPNDGVPNTTGRRSGARRRFPRRLRSRPLSEPAVSEAVPEPTGPSASSAPAAPRSEAAWEPRSPPRPG